MRSFVHVSGSAASPGRRPRLKFLWVQVFVDVVPISFESVITTGNFFDYAGRRESPGRHTKCNQGGY
jgi:hypothetical protein